MMVSLRATLALAALLLASAALEAQTTFKYRFKKGDTLRYDLAIVTKGTTRATGGNEISGTEKQIISMSWTVDSVDDKGTAKIQVTFDRVKLIGEQDKVTVEVTSDTKDADKDPAKSMLIIARAMAKVAGTFTMSPQGEIKDVTILPSAIKEMRSIPGAEKSADVYNDANLQTTLRNATLGLPLDPIAKGKTWKLKVEYPSPYGKVTGEMVYSYAGKAQYAGRTLDKFEIKPKLKIETDPKAPVPITIKTFEHDGAVYFDSDGGRLVESVSLEITEVQADVKGKILSRKTEMSTTLKLVK
jgi:hypothetical protein